MDINGKSDLLSIMQKATLRDGQKVTIVGFDKDSDGGRLVKVSWENVLDEYHWKYVKPEDILISVDNEII